MPGKDYRYETENFTLRQVKKEDAPDLLRCYSDPEAVALMNDDNCVGGFLFESLEQTEQAIHFWNNDVSQYARPAVIDKRTGRAVGTLEVFGGETGVLRLDFTKMRRELGIAYCGLACCLCSENAGCKGCKQNGCAAWGQCQNYGCVTERGLEGCWECPEFPCGKGMLGNPRMRAFARFAREHGVERLLDCLERNERAGIVYHYPGGLTGGYDLENEQEILDLLEHGRQK